MLAKKKLKKFELLSHTADIKFRIYGENYEEILKNSFLALKNFLSPKILIKEKIEKELKIQGFDLIDLFITFLSEILALTYIEKVIFKIQDLSLDLENKKLQVKLKGYKFKHLTKDIKAITYHQAKLEKTKNGIIFEFIVDI